MTDVVLRELVDRVAVLSLNRPEKHNAFNDAMIEAWSDAVSWAIAEPDARCILIRGEGPSFSSGRDVTELGRRAKGETDYEFVRRAQDDMIRLSDTPKPVVAALKGYCFGGSFELALRADIRVAATDVKMRFPEIGFGILPDTGGTQLLTMLAGPSRAKLLIMTGEQLSADTAFSWGVVDQVVSPDELEATALDLARKLADAVRRGTRAELIAQTALFASADYSEARAAHTEGRKPRFTGH